MRSRIADCDLSSSARRAVRSSRWRVNELYCSKAFLLTWEYFLRAREVAWRRLIACDDAQTVVS